MRNIILGSLFFITACTTQRKAEKYFDEHPKIAAEYAARKFPPRVEYIEGKAVVDSSDYNAFIDALTNSYDLQLKEYEKLLSEKDSIENLLIAKSRAEGYEPVVIHVPYVSPVDSVRIVRNFLTIAKIPVIKINKTDTVFQENTAKIVALSFTLNDLEKKIARTEGLLQAALAQKKEAVSDRNKWRLLFFALLAAITIYIFRKPILNLLNPIKAFWPF